jgi:HD-like signal output (HDOD) protein
VTAAAAIMHPSSPATSIPTPPPDAFAFVEELATELSAGTVELPSFPAVVARIHRALANENVTTEDVARLVSAEPAIATRVLMMANSAASLNPGNKRVTDLGTAIARLGMNTVRTASIAHAMEQMKKANTFKSIATELQLLWQRSVLLAALAHVTARRFAPVSAGEAMLAGLLHGVGRLYIISRASRHPQLFESKAAFQEIVNDWHASIAKALLESWGMPEDVVRAVAEFENPQREVRGAIALTDVLSIASLLAAHRGKPELLEIDEQSSAAAARLKVTAATGAELLEESRSEVATLLQLLGTK